MNKIKKHKKFFNKFITFLMVAIGTIQINYLIYYYFTFLYNLNVNLNVNIKYYSKIKGDSIGENIYHSLFFNLFSSTLPPNGIISILELILRFSC